MSFVSEAVHLLPAPVSPCGTEWCYADMLYVNVVTAKQFWKIKMGKIGQKREYHVVPDTVRKRSAQEVVSLGASSGQSEEGFLWFKNVHFNNSIPSSTFLQKEKTWGVGRISIINTFTRQLIMHWKYFPCSWNHTYRLYFTVQQIITALAEYRSTHFVSLGVCASSTAKIEAVMPARLLLATELQVH